MPKIQITSKGIRAALKKYTPYHSIAEYIWNGFDAKASRIDIDFSSDEIGNISTLTVRDNGYGIPNAKLQEKFEPLFESQKALENKLKKNQSALHGKNGIGRLTFFTFARSVVWETVYHEAETNWTYEIYSNSENINFYTGINAAPKKTDKSLRTTVIFSGVHSINAFSLGERFEDFLLKEFGWFLALNKNRDFSININGTALNFQRKVTESEEFSVTHEKSDTDFQITYVQWNEKNSNEPSRYYYLNSQNVELWKEPTAVKNKGEQFYHSVFIKSSYFDNFNFQKIIDTENQKSLFVGSRNDAQFKFLRKKLANYLRIKRRPFLKSFAQKLIDSYEEQRIFPANMNKNLQKTIMAIYEMQPKIFTSLNIEQRRMLSGLLNIALVNGKKEEMIALLETAIELNDLEKSELTELFMSEQIFSH